MKSSNHHLCVIRVVRISYSSVQSISNEDLGVRRVSAKFVPKLLSADQNDKRASVAQDLLDCVKNEENFLKPLRRPLSSLCRFLKARDWDIDVAEKALKATIEYRRTVKPLEVDCQWCHDRPGYHSIRQVGFDELGRPVIYSSFIQTTARKITVEDSIRHVTYLIENAKVTMRPGVTTWVFIIDCTGLRLPLCNPRLGYGVTQIMSNHYPERLGMVICLNHSPVFQGVWRAIKAFLHPNTVAKMLLIRSRSKVQQTFSKYFSPELTQWLLEEIRLNKQKPFPASQRTFWNKPAKNGDHDPRGCASYVANFIEPYSEKSLILIPGFHKPHPTILDSIRGVLDSDKEASLDSSELESNSPLPADEEDTLSYSDDELSNMADITIDEEFQIPKDSIPIRS
uniref:CRAL-TRIO domain-containing protein n=1 Tax=Octopus bimaculoides TaxID=37653 RepID=A0A0L8IGV2_OCTBM